MESEYKQYVRAAICSLNNHPLDFGNNYENIRKSILLSKQQKCSIRLGAELEVSGYMCQDHFSQYDTVVHSWQVIYKILESGITEGILCDIGMPVLHKSVLYNCRIIILNSKIIGIRAKMNLADGGNYFQSRWFAPWRYQHIQDFSLPQAIANLIKVRSVPIGHFLVKCNDAIIGFQICEQAWVAQNPMIQQSLDGAEIFFNSSASHIEQGKLKRKLQLVEELTQKHGGAYLYANNKGCDGTRLLFDGGCMFSYNGKIRALSPLFSLSNISITKAEFSLAAIKNYRLSNRSFSRSSASNTKILKKIEAHITLGTEQKLWNQEKSQQIVKQIKKTYEYPSVTYQPSVFIWDYLKKSKASGLFLALSGGADSATVALVIFNMCKLLYEETIIKKKQEVLNELRSVIKEKDYLPSSAQEICSKLFFTAYLGTENSSEQTKNRAKAIATQIGANHRTLSFSSIFEEYKKLGHQIYGSDLKFQTEGGNRNTDLCLQNIQARNRMVISYLLASLQLDSRKKSGFLLVLTSSNLDESLRGYFTKYDCSSGDINPIGSLSKNALRKYLLWNKQNGITFIDSVVHADPTAELTPLKEGTIAQSDETDMGITYNQLQQYGSIRKNQKLGPVSMFERVRKLKYNTPAKIIADKVKHFFKFYSINRHKQTTISPSFHYLSSSCDDNRYDMRPFLYNTEWKFQFEEIDKRVSELQQKHEDSKGEYMIEN